MIYSRCTPHTSIDQGSVGEAASCGGASAYICDVRTAGVGQVRPRWYAMISLESSPGGLKHIVNDISRCEFSM